MTDAAVAAQAQHRSPAAMPVFGLVLLSLVAFLPSSARPPLSLVIASALVGTAMGLPLLVRLALHREQSAWLGVAFGLWCALAAAVSGAPMAWAGEYLSGTGAVFCLALVAYWAVGRCLPSGAIPAVAVAFGVGAAVNAAVAVLQGTVDLSAADILLVDERSTGLLSNPVYLGATCAAAVTLLPLLARRSATAAVGGAALFAAATQMSGARNSIVVLVLAGIWSARRCGRRRGLALLVALGLGLAGGAALQGNAETTAGARLQSISGVGPRLDNWQAGIDAGLDRPLTGYGPGRWRAATSPRRTLALARIGPDRVYADAHNLVVEYVATTGVVGAALLVGWLTSIALGLRRGSHPELTAVALALLVTHALEPQHVTVTPVMLLVAGAAARRRAPPERPTRTTSAAQAVLVVVALVVAGRIVAGDLSYRSGAIDFALDPTERASGLLWPWPDPVGTESKIHAYLARIEKDPTELVDGLAAARRARDREPDNPTRSVAVAAFLAQLGRHEAAAREYARALQLNPWSRQALQGRAAQLTVLGRPVPARACRTATELDDHPDRVLRDARRACVAPHS